MSKLWSKGEINMMNKKFTQTVVIVIVFMVVGGLILSLMPGLFLAPSPGSNTNSSGNKTQSTRPVPSNINK